MSSVASTVIQRLPIREEDKPEWHGLIEDYMVLEGFTNDRRWIAIDGRPVHTGLNTEDLVKYITNELILKLQEEKASGLVKEESIHEQARKVKDLLNVKPFPADYYVFGGDQIVAHYHRIEKPLREYGNIDDKTNGVHVFGKITPLELPISVGVTKFRVYYFDPLDLSEGGQLNVLALTHQEKLLWTEWLKQAIGFTSHLKMKQKLKTFERDIELLKEEVKKKDNLIGDFKRRVMDLQARVGEAGRFTRSSLFLSLLVPQLTLTVIFFLVGYLLMATFPPQVSCGQYFVNATSGEQHCVQQIISQNPVANNLPAVFAITGAVLGPAVGIRFIRGGD